jgi:hypothetical protein
MKSQVKNFKLAVLAVLMVLFAGFAQQAAAQSVSVSPVAVSFGIPTGTPAPASLTNVITVTSLGAGPVTLSNFAINGNFASDFTFNGNSCTTTQTAPTTCQIGIQFTSTQPAGTLEVATLSFSSSTQNNPITVPLSGAFGAIKLFDETNVTTTNASFTSLYTIANKSLNLSCPAGVPLTATISGTPDGSGYVLVDNYMTLATGSSSSNLTPVSDPNSTNLPAGNICSGTGATADEGPGGFYADCFTTNYQDTVFEDTDPLLNLDPDTFANPGNQLLTQERPNPNNAGGVPPIDVHSFLGGSPAGTYPEQALFTLLTSGFEGVYDNTTLFLVTNCTAPGIVPGASVTLNPIDPNNPASETQTADLDDSPGQNISFTSSVGVAISQNPNIITPGTVPIITDFPVPQQLFDQLVTGTSSAPAVCMRMTGELDLSVTPPAPMCKGYLMQCLDPNTGTISGDNCTNLSTELSARYLLYTAQFSSPDGPVGYNYLTNQPWAAQNPYSVGQTIVDPSGFVQQVTTAGTSGASIPTFNDAANGTTSDGTVTWTFEGVNACLNAGNGSSMACAQGTGPGMLMGSDYWLCGPGQTAPCTPLPSNTQTSNSTPIFSPGDCQLTGGLAGALCPLDLMTSFQGAADPAGKAAGKVPNSLFVPVVNMPLPTTKVSIAGQNTNGWVNAPSTATANFTANVVAYPSQGSAIPQANSFSPAAIYTVTAGFSTWPSVPDTTYPIATDLTMSNTATSPTTPFCQVGGTTPLTAFTPSSGLTAINNGNALSDGIYNLHYFPTDCAFTEGLLYNPTPAQVSDPTANWASFPFTTVGVDTQAPTYTCSPAPPANAGGWYDSNVSVNCTVTDANYVQGVSASGFSPLVDGIQGSQTETIVVSTAVPSGTINPAAMAGPTQACDLAGNCVSVQAGPFMVSVAPPLVITASSGTMVFGGTPPVITPSYMGLVNGEAATTTPPTCSTAATSTSPVGNYPSTCIGASDSIYGYFISYLPGSVSVTPAPASISLSNLTQTYTGGPLSPTVTTNPPGLSFNLTGAPDTAQGSYSVTATITNPNYSGSTSSTFTITAPPAWTITPSPYNFGVFSLGQSASNTFTIHNPGPAAVSISVSVGSSGNLGAGQPVADPDDFHITGNNCPRPLGAGASCNVTVKYISDYDDLGRSNGVYGFLTVCNGKTVLVKAEMTAKVVDPKVKLSATSYNFGPQKTGSPVTAQVVTVTNNGPTTWLLNHLTLAGSAAFKIASGANACPSNGSLASGASCNVYVTFTPAKKGAAYSTILCIGGNESDAPLNVLLKGSGD